MLSPVSLEKGGKHLIELFTHVLEEFQIRFGPPPNGFPDGFLEGARIPNPALTLALKAVERLKSFKLSSGKYLVKYGHKEHMKSLYEQGRIKISAAGTFNDPSINPAIRDEELELCIPLSKEAEIEIPGVGKTKPINGYITRKATTDYYIYCLSMILTPRLFLDFEYDSCLLIHQPSTFINRLLSAFQSQLQDWDHPGVHTSVSYIDPLLPPHLNDINIFTCKHFRYAYQKEYRLVWLPPKPHTALPDVFMDIDAVRDCCDLIIL
ncbi:MAG: hypothetical protein ACLQVJ_15005 [Syntrophobacteraceae bacterium]